jgi:Leucine-rich repeat (LRR) protein
MDYSYLDIIKIPEEALLKSNETLSLNFSANHSIKEFKGLDTFVNLKTLDIENCNLNSFPEEISSLNKLSYLDIGLNPVANNYEVIKKLSHLATLKLSANKLSKLPEVILNLTLNEIALNYN